MDFMNHYSHVKIQSLNISFTNPPSAPSNNTHPRFKKKIKCSLNGPGISSLNV